jgi:hypothetical protein
MDSGNTAARTEVGLWCLGGGGKLSVAILRKHFSRKMILL